MEIAAFALATFLRATFPTECTPRRHLIRSELSQYYLRKPMGCLVPPADADGADLVTLRLSQHHLREQMDPKLKPNWIVIDPLTRMVGMPFTG